MWTTVGGGSWSSVCGVHSVQNYIIGEGDTQKFVVYAPPYPWLLTPSHSHKLLHYRSLAHSPWPNSSPTRALSDTLHWRHMHTYIHNIIYNMYSTLLSNTATAPPVQQMTIASPPTHEHPAIMAHPQCIMILLMLFLLLNTPTALPIVPIISSLRVWRVSFTRWPLNKNHII